MRASCSAVPTWGKSSYALLLLFVITAMSLPAQTFTTLHNFDLTDGFEPVGALVQTTAGALYGSTEYGGTSSSCTYGCGTIFKITPSGTLTTLYSFCSQSGCTDGDAPYAGLLQATNGDFYGTTSEGGANGYGTVFKIAPSGTMTTLHSFDSTDGANPYAGLIQATNGDFYGTTNDGGTQNRGTVFKITPGGTLTTLHSFHFTDGDYPFAGLVQATNGDFYGTTESDKANGDGTVFEITPRGHSDHAVQLRLH